MECSIPTIPTASIPTGSGFWGRMVRTDCHESPHLLMMLLAAAVLVLGAAVVTAACAWWIHLHGDLGSGACWALGLSVGALAVLAGYSNRITGVIGALSTTRTPDAGGKG